MINNLENLPVLSENVNRKDIFNIIIRITPGTFIFFIHQNKKM